MNAETPSTRVNALSSDDTRSDVGCRTFAWTVLNEPPLHSDSKREQQSCEITLQMREERSLPSASILRNRQDPGAMMR